MAKAKTAPPPSSKPKTAPPAAKPAKSVQVTVTKPTKSVQVAATKPAPAPVSPPAPPAAASGAWRIQLGAFSQRAQAEAAYRKLAGNAALGGRSPAYIPFGQFIRLRVGPYGSKAAAAAACGALKQACFPVAPGK